MSENDQAFIYELVNSEGWLKFIGNRNIDSLAAAGDYIVRILNNEKVKYWVVSSKAAQIPMGIVTFIQRDYLDHPDIGFAFLPGFSGEGYAFEATKAVLNALLEQGEYTHILATTIPENTRSIKLLQKIGLAFDRVIEQDQEKLQVYGAATESLQDKLATKSIMR